MTTITTTTGTTTDRLPGWRATGRAAGAYRTAHPGAVADAIVDAIYGPLGPWDGLLSMIDTVPDAVADVMFDAYEREMWDAVNGISDEPVAA